jgi:hypothetical protein
MPSHAQNTQLGLPHTLSPNFNQTKRYDEWRLGVRDNPTMSLPYDDRQL